MDSVLNSVGLNSESDQGLYSYPEDFLLEGSRSWIWVGSLLSVGC